MTNKLVNTELLAHVKEMGAYFLEQLVSLKQQCAGIADVRGRGLMLGLQMDEAVPAKSVHKALLDAGFVTATAGNNVLRFLPPYVVQKEHIDSLVTALKTVLEPR